jgi:mono/diheme cytochrome c family protein
MAKLGTTRRMRRGVFVGAAAAFALVGASGCRREAKWAVYEPQPSPELEEKAWKAAAFTPLADSRAGSTVALGRLDGKALAFVADSDDKSLHAIDLASRTELAATALGGSPAQIVVGRGRVYAALRDAAAVAVLEPTGNSDGTLVEVGRMATAEEPIGLSLTPDCATLLVASGWGRVLEGFSTTTLAKTISVDLPREPRAVVTSSDGTKAFVSHAVGAVMSVVDLAAANGNAIALRGSEDPLFVRRTCFRGCRLPMQIDFMVADPTPDAFPAMHPRSACQGFSLATITVGKSEHVLAPEVMVSTGPALMVSGGYGGSQEDGAPPETADVGVVDAATATALPESLHIGGPNFDQRRFLGAACLLPRAAAVDAAHGALFVACAGSDRLIEYDATKPNPGGYERRRWTVGAGPSGIAVDADAANAIVWSQFDRSITFASLAKGSKDTATVALAPVPHADGDDVLTRGRSLFHAVGDARVSSDGRACASCHPDGRDDGLVWSSPDGPRQTPMLAGRLVHTAPYGWTGSRDTVTGHMHDTMSRLHGKGLPDSDVDAIAAYITTLKTPTVAPHAADADVARGRELFLSEETHCVQCHIPDGTFTDGQRHDVGSASAVDRARAFDTPSLRFVGGTAPYFHDGRYATFRELFAATDGKMGNTKQLSDRDLGALEAYLKTL